MKNNWKIFKRLLMLEYYGTVAKPLDLPNKIIKSNLLVELKSVKAKNISSDNGIVSFKGGPFRLVSSMNPLIFVGSGEVDILGDDPNIQYLLSLRVGHFISFSGAVFIFLASISFSNSPLNESLMISIFSYLIMFLANVLVCLSSFKFLLRRCLSVKSKK